MNKIITQFDNLKICYSVEEFCRAASIGRTFFYRMVATKKIKIIKLAGRTLIPRAEAERFANGEVQ